MDRFSNGYSSIGGQVGTAHETYAWWWRLVSFIASFLILAGFLSLQPLVEQDPKLNLPEIGVVIIAAIFLCGGFATTALLCFVCRDSQYQLDVILTPALLATLTGFLSILYNEAISSRYEWKTASIVGICIGVLGSTVYGILAALVHRRQTYIGAQISDKPGERFRRLFGRSSKSKSKPSTPKTPIITVIPGEAPVQIMPGQRSEEEESTRQQMLGLLKPRDNVAGRSSDNSLRTTYNIELPSMPRTTSDNRISMPPHVRDYYSPLDGDGYRSSVVRAGADSDANSIESTPPGTLIGHSRTAAQTSEQDMSRNNHRLGIERTDPRARSTSRELRRREIETGEST